MNTYKALARNGLVLATVKCNTLTEARDTIGRQLHDSKEGDSWELNERRVLALFNQEEVKVMEKQLEGLLLIRNTANEGYGISYEVARDIASKAIKEVQRLERLLLQGGYIYRQGE